MVGADQHKFKRKRRPSYLEDGVDLQDLLLDGVQMALRRRVLLAVGVVEPKGRHVDDLSD